MCSWAGTVAEIYRIYEAFVAACDCPAPYKDTVCYLSIHQFHP